MGYPESHIPSLEVTPPDSYFSNERVNISAVNVMIYISLSILAAFTTRYW